MENRSDSSNIRLDWLTLPGEAKAISPKLSDQLSSRVKQRIEQGEYGPEKIEYIAEVDFNVTKGSLQLDKRRLEMLRSLCQLWNIDFLPAKISSHRPFIGPIIVAFKKAIYPIVKVLLKDLVHQQRSFNASVVALAVELANEDKRGNSCSDNSPDLSHH